MTNAALLKELRAMVNEKGAAQVAVWLNYRDTRPINVWLSTKKIPNSRIEAVRSLIEKRS